MELLKLVVAILTIIEKKKKKDVIEEMIQAIENREAEVDVKTVKASDKKCVKPSVKKPAAKKTAKKSAK